VGVYVTDHPAATVVINQAGQLCPGQGVDAAIQPRRYGAGRAGDAQVAHGGDFGRRRLQHRAAGFVGLPRFWRRQAVQRGPAGGADEVEKDGDFRIELHGVWLRLCDDDENGGGGAASAE